MNYSLVKATSWNLAGYLYLLITSIISVPILISSLGIETFGHYALIIATITLASSLDLGLSAAVVRLLSQKRQDHKTIWASSHWLFILTGLIAASISTIIISSLSLPYPLLPYVFGHTLCGHILAHYLTLPQSKGHFHLYNLKPFIVGTGNTLLSAYLAYHGFGLHILLLAQVSTIILTILLLAHYSFDHFGHLPLRASSLHYRELLGFGLKNQLGKLAGQIGAQYAKFLLAPISAMAVSSYTIGQGIIHRLAGGLTQLSTALYPLSSSRAGTSTLRALYHRLQLYLLCLSVLGIILFYLVGYTLVSLWLRDPILVANVYSVMQILVWYLAILVLTPLPSVILDGSGQPGLTSIFASLPVFFEIILAVILLPSYGLFAPPIAALISIIIITPPLLYFTELALSNKHKNI